MSAEGVRAPHDTDVELETALPAVRHWLGNRQPRVALVLGSGLGGATGLLVDGTRISCRDIPGFPIPTAEGHGAELLAGSLAGRDTIVQSGRFHLYEGRLAAAAILSVRLFARLGVTHLVLTNAAGGIRPTLRPGTLMLIADQINFAFRSPLLGSPCTGEERFPDMSDAYDPGWRTQAREVARRLGIELTEGVYAGVAGPSYETPAELRLLQRLGADAVGMSTVPEVIAARARGMKCLGISAITNATSGRATQRLLHRDVLEAAARVGATLGQLLMGVVSVPPGPPAAAR